MKALLALASITLLSACAATRPIETHAASAATDFPHGQRVAIMLSYFRFTPSNIDLVAGKPYVLMLKDSGAGGHDFTAEFLAAAAIAPADASQVAGRRIELVGHQTASIHVIPTTASTGRHVPISAMRRWA
ncbi:MAG: copper-binding protein [Novosphingobium lindaniclasticum]|jgi:uncharacterized cupredoxin-like copper-binding protein|uniref:hypothetical protein n=1 Tax=Novosphingobium lindaniclasticum TaxID=1329895 RepID=UPI00240A14D8|nr:hypothetical protein [Novosphingobium lindaniclasticum]MDF2638672.1 copper-binding protein [Novosphingobium lindaniclasticum]